MSRPRRDWSPADEERLAELSQGVLPPVLRLRQARLEGRKRRHERLVRVTRIAPWFNWYPCRRWGFRAETRFPAQVLRQAALRPGRGGRR